MFFLIYCFGVHFNQFFLLYCFTLALSLYAFILVMPGFGREDVAGWFCHSSARAVSIYIFFVALVFYSLWLKSILPAIVSNSVPAEVTENDFLVNPIHVIASVSLVFMVFLTIALAAMVVMLAVREINEDNTIAIVFGILSVLSLLFSVLLFRKIKPSS